MIQLLLNKLKTHKVEISLLLLYISIIFNNQVTGILVVILTVIILTDKENYTFKLKKKQSITIVFFTYIIIREFFDINIVKGFEFIVRLLPLLLFPLTLALYPFKKKQVDNITKYSALSNLLFYLISIFYGVYLFVSNDVNNTLRFDYYQWVVPIKFGFHPPYWGLLIVLSSIPIVFNERFKIHFRAIYVFTTLLFLILLSSRTALTLFLLVIIFYFVFNKKITIKVKVISIGSLFVISSFMIVSSSYLKEKLENNTGFLERIELWKSSEKVIKSNLYFGTGFSQVKNSIKDYSFKEKENYDPHNMYIYFLISIGMIGSILFLLSLIINDFYTNEYIVLLIIILLSFVTESVLIRQMGIVMVSLFLSLLSNKNFKLS